MISALVLLAMAVIAVLLMGLLFLPYWAYTTWSDRRHEARAAEDHSRFMAKMNMAQELAHQLNKPVPKNLPGEDEVARTVAKADGRETLKQEVEAVLRESGLQFPEGWQS